MRMMKSMKSGTRQSGLSLLCCLLYNFGSFLGSLCLTFYTSKVGGPFTETPLLQRVVWGSK